MHLRRTDSKGLTTLEMTLNYFRAGNPTVIVTYFKKLQVALGENNSLIKSGHNTGRKVAYSVNKT